LLFNQKKKTKFVNLLKLFWKKKTKRHKQKTFHYPKTPPQQNKKTLKQTPETNILKFINNLKQQSSKLSKDVQTRHSDSERNFFFQGIPTKAASFHANHEKN
jgi:hypothetical protein